MRPPLPSTTSLRIVALPAFPVRYEQSEFDAYLSKPIDPFQLVEQIARVATRPAAASAKLG